MGKAILMVIGNDIQEAAGTLQLCAGQPAGIEAAIHAARQLYDDDSTEGLLLVDASNAFNQLNRQAALHNISTLCPPLATVLQNTYGVMRTFTSVVTRLLCIGHLEIWRPIELHSHAPLKITSNHRCQENRERVSAGDRQTKSSNKDLKTMFFSISKSDMRKKKGERSMYTEKKFFRHCSCLWRRATAGL